MAITYPRDLPTQLLRPPRFELDYTPLGDTSRTAGGEVNFQEKIGGTLWALALTTKPLGERDYSAVHAWYQSFRGGAYSFKAYDVRRCWPLAYGPAVLALTRFGGGAFDGTCSVTAAGGSAVSLSSLPANYQITTGDYLSFPWRGRQQLVKFLQSVNANGAGVVSGVEIGPWLLAGGAVPATATLVRAWLLMRPINGSWKGGRSSLDAVSFEAVESAT
jgi:hypothetical protein